MKEPDFLTTLGNVLRERYGDRLGRYSIAGLVRHIQGKTGYSEAGVRLILSGQRGLRPEVIEAAAEFVGLKAADFAEYRALKLHELIESDPILRDKLFRIATGGDTCGENQ